MYKYSAPNPMMHDQRLWSKTEKYSMHNRNSFGQTETFSIPEPEEDKPIIIKNEEKKEAIELDTQYRIKIWCLPAYTDEVVDRLYGEKYNKIKYGKKFTFEGIIQSQDDLHINLWTNTKAVTENSIVFPQTNDKRWWRIVKITEKDGHYLASGIISEHQPSFADPE